ncbi:MAG: sugar ABC transporter permease [Spirochaetia bacterium]|nr:sugar ABC transporter permease [Spirochaetia bacterium]
MGRTQKELHTKRIVRYHATNILFMLPAFLFLLVVVIIPFFQGIPYSFTNWKSLLNVNKDFVGLRNYQILLTNEHFLSTFANTFEYTILYILLANAIGLGIALTLQRSSLFNNFARTVVFMPFVVSLTAGAIVWNYVFTDIYSVLFNKISPFGLSDQVIYAMVIVGVWRDLGYCMLIFIAGLTAIPQDYYEAALIEGSGRFHRFTRITLPLIVPSFTANVTLLLAWGLKLFDLPMVVARNMQAAETTSIFIYDYIFAYSKAGIGQAAAIICTIVLVVITRVVTYFFRKMEVEA